MDDLILLARFKGANQTWADGLERVKRNLETRLGMPDSKDLQWACDWAELDHIICKMRELVETGTL